MIATIAVTAAKLVEQIQSHFKESLTIKISRQTVRNCKSLYSWRPLSEVVDGSYLQK